MWPPALRYPEDGSIFLKNVNNHLQDIMHHVADDSHLDIAAITSNVAQIITYVCMCVCVCVCVRMYTYLLLYMYVRMCVYVCMFVCIYMHICVYMYVYIHRVSQEECARLREGVPYVKVYRYNPKHLCPKLNGYGDKGQRSLKL